jgi:membrane protein YdbS with pleckstrin-like domain
MLDSLRLQLLRLLRVPRDPAPPPGDPQLVQTFRAAPNFFRYSVAVWFVKQLSALAGLLFGYLFLRGVVGSAGPFAYFGLIEQFFVLLFIAQLPFSFALLRLDFEMRWYILSDRSLRIREGILSVREQTMTFANIQNITIRQNPLQRFFGISTVAVRAAGGGSTTGGARKGSAGSSHEATFEGVDNGEVIRDAIRARIRLHRDAGLGDPDEVAVLEHASSGTDAAALPVAAARRLLAEVRALRADLPNAGRSPGPVGGR